METTGWYGFRGPAYALPWKSSLGTGAKTMTQGPKPRSGSGNRIWRCGRKKDGGMQCQVTLHINHLAASSSFGPRQSPEASRLCSRMCSVSGRPRHHARGGYQLHGTCFCLADPDLARGRFHAATGWANYWPALFSLFGRQRSGKHGFCSRNVEPRYDDVDGRAPHTGPRNFRRLASVWLLELAMVIHGGGPRVCLSG